MDDLPIGGSPVTFSGSSNSSGYSHSVDIEDESVIGMRTVRAKMRNDGVCGASTGFTYLFYPLRAGKSQVTVRFGRSWEPDTMRVEAAYAFVVPEIGDAAAVDAAVEEAQAKVASVKASIAFFGKELVLPIKRPEEEEDPFSSSGPPGPALLALAEHLADCKAVLDKAERGAEHGRQMELVATELAAVKDEQAALELDISQLEAAEQAEAERRAKEESEDGGGLMTLAPLLCKTLASPMGMGRMRQSRDVGSTPEEGELFDAKDNLRCEREIVEELKKCVAELRGEE